MNQTYFVLIILLIVILFVMLFITRKQIQKQNQQSIKEMQEVLQNQQVIGLQFVKEQERSIVMWKDQMRTQLLEFQNTTQQQILMMSRNVSSNLNESMQNSSQLFHQVLEQVSRVDESSKNLAKLSSEIQELQFIFHDKKTRGIFGEIELYSLLANIYGEEGLYYQKQVKLSTGVIVDCVLLNETLPMICIDAKFPLENYNRLISAGNKKEELHYQKLFANDVKKQIISVSTKYIIANETADFVYLFLPAEALFSYIHAHLSSLVEFAYSNHVYLVSPSTLMAYLTVMKKVHLDQKQSENIKEVKLALKKLKVEFERFSGRYHVITKDFEKTYQDLHSLSVTTDKVLREFQKIEKGDIV